ncbi:MAG: hypothetical protein K5851_01840 [Lachnospiraceae bacterium]|nr:hypothetical protein [Lachnospiraceae bacterium]
MKSKSIIKVIVFFLILNFLLISSSHITKKIAVEKQDLGLLKRNGIEIELLKEKRNSIDVLFLGDSECYTSYSPMQIWGEKGITSFVCAQSGQTPGESFHLINLALKQQMPKVVFMEMNLYFQYSGAIPAAKDLFVNTVNDFYSVVSYHSVWKSAFDVKEKNSQSFKGFNVYSGVIPSQYPADYMNISKENCKMSFYNKMMLMRTVNKIKSHNAKIVFYSAPSPKNHNMEKHNVIASLAKHYNVPYIDLNLKPEVGIDLNKDILDGGDHINISGAEKTSTYFAKYLIQYNLRDKRCDPKFKDWNDEEVKYKKFTSKLIQDIRVV